MFSRDVANFEIVFGYSHDIEVQVGKPIQRRLRNRQGMVRQFNLKMVNGKYDVTKCDLCPRVGGCNNFKTAL